MDLIINIINGKSRSYADVRVPTGYCFYDSTADDKTYMERVITPIINENELRQRFIVVQGNYETLNNERSAEYDK